MPQLEKINEAVLRGNFADIAEMVQKALDEGISPPDIIDKGLIAGMNVVGVRFKKDEMFIPEVMVSAKTMHTGMEMLRPLLTDEGRKTTQTVVIGTVKGDLHDVGKNLVSMMFQGAGFEVIDIGVDQKAQNFVEAVQKSSAQAVAMSALLTTTMKEMEGVVGGLKQANLTDSVNIIIGGAPVTEDFAVSIGADGYAPDAGSAVEKLRELVN